MCLIMRYYILYYKYCIEHLNHVTFDIEINIDIAMFKRQEYLYKRKDLVDFSLVISCVVSIVLNFECQRNTLNVNNS